MKRGQPPSRQPPTPGGAPEGRCPTCGEPTTLSATNRARPFCSTRCKWVDMGKWMDGRYSIEDLGDDRIRVLTEIFGRTTPIELHYGEPADPDADAADDA